MITDPFGRPINNLRVSITQQCPLKCFFCHKEGQNYVSSNEMKAEDIERIVEIVSDYCCDLKVKITGGEPLLRDDILEIIQRINTIPKVKEAALTTNGILLNRLAKPLKEKGLKRVNVTLNSLNPSTYRYITGTDLIRDVVKGIKASVKAGLSPVKVNMVVLKDINAAEVWDMVRFSIKNNLILQLIEFETYNEKDEYYKKYHLDLSEIENELKERSQEIIIRKMQKRNKYLLRGGGEVEVVKPMHNSEFCANCYKLRITSDGKFKPCLFCSHNQVDFLTPMRDGASDIALKELLREAIQRRRPYFT